MTEARGPGTHCGSVGRPHSGIIEDRDGHCGTAARARGARAARPSRRPPRFVGRHQRLLRLGWPVPSRADAQARRRSSPALGEPRRVRSGPRRSECFGTGGPGYEASFGRERPSPLLVAAPTMTAAERYPPIRSAGRPPRMAAHRSPPSNVATRANTINLPRSTAQGRAVRPCLVNLGRAGWALDHDASPAPTRTARHVSPRGGRAARHDHRR